MWSASLQCPEPSNGNGIRPCAAELKQHLSCRSARVVPPQHVIFSQGEHPYSVCFICSGLVKLTRTEHSGQRVILGLRKAGWLLGLPPAITDMPYTVTAETVTRSRLCYMSKDRLKEAMAADTRLGMWIVMLLGRGMYSNMLNFSDRSCLSARQRLEKFLMQMIGLVENRDKDKAVRLPVLLKQWEVAQLLALTPQHLSRLVRQMEREGILVRKNGWMIIPDPDRLWNPEISPVKFPS